mgnify:CR=1 FL=1
MWFFSFFHTDNYIIFTEQPWVFGDFPTVLVKHVLQGLPIGASMSWDASSPLRFHVVEKATGHRCQLMTEPVYRGRNVNCRVV